jgi:SAM-dependent methyltransferase
MKAKYDTIGHHYNQTRKADPYLTERLFKNLNPKQSGQYLDIGCGTGNYTDALQRKGFNFIGIDPSLKMLEKGKLKNQDIDWRIGTAEKTGLEDNFVDGIIASLTIHHWKDLDLSFQELYRILKPGGKVVLFTSTPEQMKGYWLNHYFPTMLEDSIIQMPDIEKVKKAMTIAGFKNFITEKYAIQANLKDQFLYCGKQQPELYLNPNIRNGISSFSALANKEEVENGLNKLETDIHSGKINEVIQSYENELGDYLYLIGQK